MWGIPENEKILHTEVCRVERGLDMSAQLLDGKALAKEIKEKLKEEIKGLGATPALVAVQVGQNAASAVYTKSQQKTAEGLGIKYDLLELEETTTQEELFRKIRDLNNNAQVNGIILQMPVPQHINAKEVTKYIAPEKDAEGLHPQNMGKVVFGKPAITPCTPAAVIALINSVPDLNLYGKEAVVVGHSEIVGKPVALLLLDKFATTTVCHIGTGERGLLPEHVKHAEILVVAVGKAGLIKGQWIKEGAIVIDVGINRVGDKIVGDVEFEEAQKRAAYITPVPGGVGPLTVTMLMKNVVEAYKLQRS